MSRTRGVWPTWLACAVCVLVPVRARAEAGAGQKAAAESLFDDALKAMKSGRYADACPKLEESERIDPGIGTLLYLGECYEKTGRTASAWATFREAASSAQAKGETERARVAASRADRLQPGLSKLTISVASETAQLNGLHVSRDNLAVEGSLFGVAIPVDPGRYHVVASAEGYEPFQTDLEVLANADQKSLQIPGLKPLPPGSAFAAQVGSPDTTVAGSGTATGSGTASSAGAVSPVTDAGTTRGHRNMRTAAYLTGALGIVGLGVGSYFGIRAISKNSDAESYCPRGDKCDDQRGADLSGQARNAAVASNITMAVGAAFVVAGVVFYLSSEPARSARLELHPIVDRTVAGVGFGGAFR